MPDIFRLKKDRSQLSFHVEGASASVENAAIAYQSPSLLAAGANARDVALLSTTTNLLLSLLLLKVPSVVKHGDALKRAAVLLSAASALGWIPLIVVTLLVKNISPTLLVVLWVTNLVPNLLTGPLIDKWVSDLVPSGKIGRYLSIRFILSTGTYISFFYVMGFMLDHYQGSPTGGFPLVYLVAFVASIGSLLLILLPRAVVPLGETSASDFGLKAFIRESKQGNLGPFIVFTALMMFAASISGAFFSIYMLRDLHFSYLTYTLIVSTEVIARIAVSYFGGRWIDRAGAIKVLRCAALIVPFNPVLWLFSHNVAYLMCIQVLSGVSWATYDLSTQSFLCRDSPEEKRLHYIVYHRSIITLASAIGPLAGAYLLNVMYPVLGNPILGIFLASGALRLLVVLIFLPRLKSIPANSAESEPAFPLVVAPQAPKLANLKAQSYQMRCPDRPGRRPERVIRPDFEPAQRQGVFYRPASWGQSLDPSPVSVKQNVRQDLLYRPDKQYKLPPAVIASVKSSSTIMRLKEKQLVR